MSSQPPAKRQKQSPSSPSMLRDTEASAPVTATSGTSLPSLPTLPPIQVSRQAGVPVMGPQSGIESTKTPEATLPRSILNTIPPPQSSPSSPLNPRKRRASRSPKLDTLPPGTTLPSEASASVSIPSLLTSDDSVKKRGRTNRPWTAEEEQRLKQMRDARDSWGEIAKAFPNRTEGSVKKHWYKDMHYAEFAADETVALREAIKEYEANKWKAIGAKLGKPAKACEQYAREHFKNL